MRLCVGHAKDIFFSTARGTGRQYRGWWAGHGTVGGWSESDRLAEGQG